jgi:predicted nucleotidyltransferase
LSDQDSVGAFDPDRILAVLDRRGVEYVLVGGVAARAHGARRATADIDCVPSTDAVNLERLAEALRELGARLRVAGMSDAEAKALPMQLDGVTLAAFGSSTWMTDAGPLDLLVELRDPSGGRHPYEDLNSRASDIAVGGVTVRIASLGDIVASKQYAARPKDLEALPELLGLIERLEGD